MMSKQFTINPKLDFAIERLIDAPTRLVWEALTKPEHLKEWYMPRRWGRVSANRNGRATGRHLQHRHRDGRRSGGSQPRLFPWKLFRWSDLSGPPCCSPRAEA
jgi:uncharacterized protein YndB with AHSA1/START domain